MKLPVSHTHWKRIVEFATLCVLAFSLAGSVLATPSSAKAAEKFGWKFEYDDADRVTRVTDPAGRDTRLQYSFDGARRLRKMIRVRADEPSVAREFDESGRLQSMTDGAGTVSYGYDERGRLNRVQRQGTAAVAYAYDTQDRVTRLQVGDFYRVEYIYDFLGRLAAMKTPAGDIQYEYLTGQGKVVRTLTNGVKTIWEYEPNGRLRQITHADGRNAILAEYTYDYRPDGLIKAIRERSPSGQFVKAYEYDLVGRLVKASGPGGQQYAYEYDAIGNRTKAVSTGKPAQTYAYDWGGRLTAVDGNPTEHDAAGNLTSLTIAGSTLKYRHNQDGQLAEVLDGKVSYRYDGDGNLIGRRAGGVEVIFVPDPLASIWRPLVTTGKGGHREIVVWEGDAPLLMIRDGKPAYFLHDHLGSVRMVTDAQVRATHWVDYDPFGAVVSPGSSAEFAPRFAGLFWDTEASADLTSARAYRPDVGRFVQVDPRHRVPLGKRQAFSSYDYCGGDPVNFLDRNGADSEWAADVSMFMTGVFATPALRWTGVYNATLQPGAERDIVIEQIVADAWFMAGKTGGDQGHATRAHDLINNWRYGKATLPDKYRGAQLVVSPDEWRTAEHYMLIRSEIEDGNIPGLNGVHGFDQRGPAVGRLVNLWLLDNLFIPGWNALHIVGETGFLTSSEAQKLARMAALPQTAKNVWRRFFDQSERDKVAEDWFPGTKKSQVEWADRAKIDSLARLHGMDAIKQLSSALQAIQVQKYREFQGKAVRSDSSRQVPSGRGPEKPKLSEPRRRDDLPRREDPPPPPPSPPPPPPPPPSPPPQPPPSSSSSSSSSPSSSSSSSSSQPPPAPPAGVDRAFAQYSPVYPSRVGGVYLAGAGQSLAGTGLLDGIAFDRNNNLVLVGKGGSETKLPPLRLDDVVTIFRSVFLHGEGPTVTIDPSPENPEGSAMIIRHGKATENTYVGWVLYQADRLMKGHTLGIDNITTKDVTTAVPGYADVLNTIYFGGESPEKLRKQGHWERFWIVPAATRRYVAPKKELTLFDVPLEVKTQSMKWEKGALVDDVQAKSSPGALAFRQWFTANYDRIAGERFLTPPKESGISAPVPVFTELRRIALITAIAEKLRDQGVPLPFWMRDYDVRPVPFEKITPGLEVRRSNSNVIARVYGGVNLSAADKDVKTYTAGREAPPASGTDAVVVRQHLALAGALEEAIRPVSAGSEPMQVRALAHEGTSYQVASLPGAGTLALAPARLEEVDLMAPVPGRAPIRLVRSYNSFFNPSGPWGKGWALDLPRLDQVRLPVRRGDKGTEYQTAFELVTPLNSVYARFSRVESVPALDGTRLQVPDEPGEFFGVADGRPDFLSGPTQALLRKDGGTWHFSKSGELVATEQDGSRVVYERDEKGRLTRVVGLLGRRSFATIELRYDAAGRIEAATAKAEQREEAVRYEYDSAGRLAAVVSDAGRMGYRYDGSLLTEVTSRGAGKQAAKATDTVMRRFQYGPRGRLLAEFGPDGAKTEYRVTTDKNGSAVTAASAVGGDKNARADTVRYDPTLRPVEAAYADGTKVAWSYPPGGGIAVDLKAAEGANIRFTEAADQRSRTVELDANRKLTAQYDPAGRLTALADNGQPVLRQTWTASGRLLSAGDDTAAANFEYDPDGLVARVLLAPPGERGPFKTWQATRLDPAGRPVEVTDYRGLQASIEYDGKGEPRAAVVKRDGKNYGFQIARDETGRIREVKSSWGASQYAYDALGLLSRIEVESNGQKSAAEWKSGLLQKVRQFDGGEFSLSYYQDPKRAGLPKEIIAPNRLVLAYDYDASNRLSQVAVGSIYRLLLDYDARGRLAGWNYAPGKR